MYRKKDFCKLVEDYKKSNGYIEKSIKDTIIKHKEIIFGVDSTKCIKSLDQILNQMIIEMGTGKVLGPKVDYTYWKEKL